MRELIVEAVQDILLTAVLAVLSLGGAYALYYIDLARRRLQERAQLDLVDRMIHRAAALAETVVMSLEGTVAKELREMVKDGKVSRAELQAVGDAAVKIVLDRLGEDGRTVLEESLGDVRAFVKDLVEAKVEEMKRGLLPAGMEEIAKNWLGSGG